MERQPATNHEDEEVKLNVTVSGTVDDINSVWLFWQGVTNYTYPYAYVRNDTTATTEFYINLSTGN